jgi:hypothetical protein
MKASWHYRAKGQIWRVMPTEAGFLIGEDRDSSKKHVTFFCIEAKSGRIAWEGMTFGENWWIGMETAVDQKLLLHGYAVPDMPLHKRLIAVDMSSGEKLWENADVCFEFIHDRQIIASSVSSGTKNMVVLDPTSGAILGPMPTAAELRHPENKDSAVFPRVYAEGAEQLSNDHFTSRATNGPIEYLRTGSFTILSHCHAISAAEDRPLFSQVLEVHRDSSVVYKDVLFGRTPSMIPNAFLLQGTMLYYVKEGKVLTAVPLRKSESW